MNPVRFNAAKIQRGAVVDDQLDRTDRMLDHDLAARAALRVRTGPGGRVLMAPSGGLMDTWWNGSAWVVSAL